MNDQTAELTQTRSITPNGVHAYLRARGWELIGPYHGNTGDVYRFEDERQSALVPASAEYADYPVRILQLAELLARVENRRTMSILADLSSAGADLIRVRLPEAADDHSVSLAVGAVLVDETRQMLAAAASSASRPRCLHRGRPNQKEAVFAESLRLGQTEPGSFVLNVLAPVAPSLTHGAQQGLIPSEPFARRATRKLVSGLQGLQEAAALVNRGGDVSAFMERVNDGVSANLCQAVARLIEVGDGMDASVCWALTRQGPDSGNDDGERTARFRAHDAPTLREAARLLMTQQEYVNEEIDGYVSALARGQNDPDGRVTMKAVIDGKLATVKAQFSDEDYAEVTRAHTDRRTISVTGELRREGWGWHLRNARDLVVDDDD